MVSKTKPVGGLVLRWCRDLFHNIGAFGYVNNRVFTYWIGELSKGPGMNHITAQDEEMTMI